MAKFKKTYEELPRAELGKYQACVIVSYEDQKKGVWVRDYAVGPFVSDEAAKIWMIDNKSSARGARQKFELELLLSPFDSESVESE